MVTVGLEVDSSKLLCCDAYDCDLLTAAFLPSSAGWCLTLKETLPWINVLVFGNSMTSIDIHCIAKGLCCLCWESQRKPLTLMRRPSYKALQTAAVTKASWLS